jgi:hypothetical protein
MGHSLPEPCMCGADDCAHCHPEHFVRGMYVGDRTDDEVAEILDACDDRASDCRLTAHCPLPTAH